VSNRFVNGSSLYRNVGTSYIPAERIDPNYRYDWMHLFNLQLAQRNARLEPRQTATSRQYVLNRLEQQFGVQDNIVEHSLLFLLKEDRMRQIVNANNINYHLLTSAVGRDQ